MIGLGSGTCPASRCAWGWAARNVVQSSRAMAPLPLLSSGKRSAAPPHGIKASAAPRGAWPPRKAADAVTGRLAGTVLSAATFHGPKQEPRGCNERHHLSGRAGRHRHVHPVRHRPALREDIMAVVTTTTDATVGATD